ncbi:hypothetical protein [uncultured Chryseobacterium sp.]|uniref:hypothetical protein n=1 Tax=uncultured Chryseobacterium sp. TaxID=259322 RepID=UPI0025DB5B33|nr:hypothetical protein [uncultured Chryseobacterium sp.]
MNIEEAKELGYDHKGYIYNFVKIYAKDTFTDLPDICARNKFYDILFDVMEFFNRNIGSYNGFMLDVIPIDDEEPFHEPSAIVWTFIALVLLTFCAWINL